MQEAGDMRHGWDLCVSGVKEHQHTAMARCSAHKILRAG